MYTFKKLATAILIAGATALVTTPVVADDQQQRACKEGVWQSLGFASQGDCVSLVSSGDVLAWNFFDDFLLSPNQENPNRDRNGNLDVWYFLTSTSLVHDPTTYFLLPNFRLDFNGDREHWDDGTGGGGLAPPLVGVVLSQEVGQVLSV